MIVVWNSVNYLWHTINYLFFGIHFLSSSGDVKCSFDRYSIKRRSSKEKGNPTESLLPWQEELCCR